MKKIILLSLIVLSIAIAYSNSFNVPFQFDDVKRIVDVKPIQSIDIKSIFNYSKSRFLLYTTFALNYYFGKYNPSGYHFVNLLIHIINSILIFYLSFLVFTSRRLFSRYSKNALMLSVFSTLIFALHPVQTESVTYIYQRGESMAGTFYLLAIFLYAKFRDNTVDYPGKYTKAMLYSLAVLSCLTAFFIKPNTVTLPAAILMYELCFITGNMKEFRNSLKYIAPFVILACIPVLTAKFDPSESRNVSVGFGGYAVSYYLTKLRVLSNALGLILMPARQRIEYDFVMSVSLFKPITTLLSLGVVIFMLGAAVVSFKKQTLITFAIAIFFIGLSVTTILVLDDMFFEHYLYLPVFGYGLILPAMIFDYFSRAKIGRKAGVILLTIIVASYAVSAYQRNKVWKTEISLWEDAVRKSPMHARSRYTLGVYYFRAKRYKEALKEYNMALAYRPMYPEAYYRLGEYYFALGDPGQSIICYNKAIEINPDFFEAYLNLGSVYYALNNISGALPCFTKALGLTQDPDYIAKINNVIKELKRHE